MGAVRGNPLSHRPRPLGPPRPARLLTGFASHITVVKSGGESLGEGANRWAEVLVFFSMVAGEIGWSGNLYAGLPSPPPGHKPASSDHRTSRLPLETSQPALAPPLPGSSPRLCRSLTCSAGGSQWAGLAVTMEFKGPTVQRPFQCSTPSAASPPMAGRISSDIPITIW